MLQRMGAHRVFARAHHRQKKNPGTILMGLRWPEPVRYVLENETLPHDPLGIITPETDRYAAAVYGGRGVIYIFDRPHRPGYLSYSILIHELAHARQDAVSVLNGFDYFGDWYNTPEAKAYKVAWQKDLRNIPLDTATGKGLYLIDNHSHFNASLHENMDEFCTFYWDMISGIDVYSERSFPPFISPVEGARRRAPNRFKWAETYLNTRY